MKCIHSPSLPAYNFQGIVSMCMNSKHLAYFGFSGVVPFFPPEEMAYQRIFWRKMSAIPRDSTIQNHKLVGVGWGGVNQSRWLQC